jgi:hypothetical protein
MAASHNNLDTRDSAVEIENIVDVKTDGSHKPPPDGEILFFARNTLYVPVSSAEE